MKSTVLFLSLTAALIGAVPDRSASADRTDADPVRIGMVQTLFTDVPAPVVNLLMPPFRSMMKEFTGLNGEIQLGGDAFDVAQSLQTDKVQLAVFHGVEFGWAQQKFPELRPLMVAMYKNPHLRAHLVVKEDSTAQNAADLKGTICALPFRSREHCRLFLERECQTAGRCSPKSFFAQVNKPMSAESAFDEVLMGKVAVAVADEVMLDNYRDVKPGCAKRLRIIKTSDVFPTSVVAYHQGSISEETLGRFRVGMMNANRNEKGRELMNLWKISSFEAVPADFAATVTEITRVYPAPVAVVPVSRVP